jgi:hypothetical protein
LGGYRVFLAITTIRTKTVGILLGEKSQPFAVLPGKLSAQMKCFSGRAT